MQFAPPLIPVKLIKRYKRFLADVQMPDGQILTVHCPNSGSMKTCVGEDWPAMISDSQNPKRKLRYSLEMIHNGTCWIGINTMRPNRLVEAAVLEGVFPTLAHYETLRREVKYGTNSRIDLLASRPGEECYIEVKNVTLLGEGGDYEFPDAVTTRGQKHLDELCTMIDQGHRAVMVFLIQRSDGRLFRPAASIDPTYAAKLREAEAHGVEIMPCLTRVTPEAITVTGQLADYDLS